VLLLVEEGRMVFAVVGAAGAVAVGCCGCDAEGSFGKVRSGSAAAEQGVAGGDLAAAVA